MPKYEYKVVPVPTACDRRARTDRTQDLAAATIESHINGLTIEGWEYVRTDSMSLRPRSWLGLGRSARREMMIFRREPFALKAGREASQQVDKVHLKVEKIGRRIEPRRIVVEDDTRRSAIAAE